jgi:glycosyltransferase involved in cell wall biosynthesis
VKVLFIARSTLYKARGGDTIQVLKTAEFLKKNNIEAEVRLTGEHLDYSGYDLLHFFNIIRPADILKHITSSRKPYVVSTIFVEYGEYEKKVRGGTIGRMLNFLPPDLIEYLKVIGRYFVNGEKIVSPAYLLLGQKRSIQKIIKNAAMLLPNSGNEYNRLYKKYKTGNRYKVIPNAIDPAIFGQSFPLAARDNNLIICAGRIEGLKNQLNLIRALRNTEFRLMIIGNPGPNQLKYFNQCKTLATSNISFVQQLTQEELVHYYSLAKVHVLPSWFETTGLSSLEAAAMGCNIVISDKGDTREYFRDEAWYCDPSSPDSIFAAVNEAAGAETRQTLAERIRKEYTWDVTARETLNAYKEALSIEKL